jgi:hypothetical protein
MSEQAHPTRVAIISAAISFFLSCVFAAYVVGQRTGVVLEIQRWKNDTAPRIEKMDLEGSVATKNFIATYEKEQAKQYDRLKKLEEQTGHLETLFWRMDKVEKKAGIDP